MGMLLVYRLLNERSDWVCVFLVFQWLPLEDGSVSQAPVILAISKGLIFKLNRNKNARHNDVGSAVQRRLGHLRQLLQERGRQQRGRRRRRGPLRQHRVPTVG